MEIIGLIILVGPFLAAIVWVLGCEDGHWGVSIPRETDGLDD